MRTYEVYNLDYSSELSYIIVDSTAEDDQANTAQGLCTLRAAVSSWSNPGSELDSCAASPSSNESEHTAIVFKPSDDQEMPMI